MSVIFAILSIAPYLALTAGQTDCTPLMQSLVSQAEATNSYGSWDACCARTGTDCYLTQAAAQPGFEPCDLPHSARAGCNRVPEGTICMIGGDTEISSSPCAWSQLRTCAQTITRSGNVMPFSAANLTSLGLTPSSILANGVLDSNMCCSASACTFSNSLASCSDQYEMSCVSDGVSNVICLPLDESDDSNYAAVIVQGCTASTFVTSANPSTPTGSLGPSSSPSGVLSSVGASSCGGSAITVTNFGMNIYRSNNTLVYAMAGDTQQSGLSPQATISPSAYGHTIPASVVDVCTITSCPLASRFDLSGSIMIDTSAIPAFVWTLPDLDAVVTVTFTDSSGSQLACLTSEISNGVTVQAPSVPIVTGTFTVALMVLGSVGSYLLPVASAAPASSATIGAPASTLPPPPPPTLTSPYPPPSMLSGTVPPLAVGSGWEAAAFAVGGTVAAGGAGTIATGGPGHYGSFNSPAAQGLYGHLNAYGAHPGGMVSAPSAPHAPTAAQTHVQAPGHGHGPPAARMDPITLFLFFQNLSSFGLLSVKLPPILRSFTVNFAWANLILIIHPFEKAARHLRKCDLGEDPVGNSKLTPTSVPPVSPQGHGIGEVTGIEAYARGLGISSQDILALTYFVLLCVLALLVVFHLVITFILHLAARSATTEEGRQASKVRGEKWRGMSSNNCLRIIMLGLSPFATFSFYQWSQSCTSTVIDATSAITVVIMLLTLGMVSLFIIHIAHRPNGHSMLFDQDGTYGRRWGSLYNTFRERSLAFVGIFLIVMLVRSAITGFGQGHGLAQMCALVVVDLVVCISLVIWRPYYSRGYNRVNYMLEFTRAISHCLMIFFVENISVEPITTTALGYIILALNSLVGLILVILTVIKMGWGKLWFRKKHEAFTKSGDAQRPISTHAPSFEVK